MINTKAVAVLSSLAALLLISMPAYSQNYLGWGPWRYSAEYHLPSVGDCIGPVLLHSIHFAPKYEDPNPPVPGPMMPCPPPPAPVRKIKEPMPPGTIHGIRPPQAVPLYPMGASPQGPVQPMVGPGMPPAS